MTGINTERAFVGDIKFHNLRDASLYAQQYALIHLGRVTEDSSFNFYFVIYCFELANLYMYTNRYE